MISEEIIEYINNLTIADTIRLQIIVQERYDTIKEKNPKKFHSIKTNTLHPEKNRLRNANYYKRKKEKLLAENEKHLIEILTENALV